MTGPIKRYLFASDFDQTLTFNDTGYVLSELLGIATEEFERKIKGMKSKSKFWKMIACCSQVVRFCSSD